MKPSRPTEPPLNHRDRRKRDAMDLALLIYDIFKEEEANGNVSGEQDKENEE